MSRGTIGSRMTSIVVPSDPTLPGYIEYHTDHALYQSGGVTFVEARGGDHGAWLLELEGQGIVDALGNPVISAVPKVGRNQPCPCGVGEKYKKCYGRPGSHMIATISDGAWIIK